MPLRRQERQPIAGLAYGANTPSPGTMAQPPRCRSRHEASLAQPADTRRPGRRLLDGPDVLAPGSQASRVRVNVARFAPALRNAWHAHANGQARHITEGSGHVKTFHHHPAVQWRTLSAKRRSVRASPGTGGLSRVRRQNCGMPSGRGRTACCPCRPRSSIQPFPAYRGRRTPIPRIRQLWRKDDRKRGRLRSSALKACTNNW